MIPKQERNCIVELRPTVDESFYHSYELETLAVAESIKQSRIYLLSIPFKILTDCSIVYSTFAKRDLVPRKLSIQDDSIKIEHGPSCKMGHVDALSRNDVTENVLRIDDDDWVLTV